MLERIWVEQERENHFLTSFLLSLVFSLAAILISHYFVPFQISGRNYGGLIAVLLTSLTASYPLLRYLEKREEEEEKMEDLEEKKLLQRHWTELEIYLAFFLGVMLAFTITAFVLPSEFFHTQSAVISSITGRMVNTGLLMTILENNISVFFLTFFLSFLLTAGMVFILVWNASVLGVFLADVSQSFSRLPLMALSYLPHGILEIGAYALAGISGFFLSHHFECFFEPDVDSRKIFKLCRDSMLILIVGLLMLLIAGFVEVL
ncbi:MAG: stage II sporulation protein M [Candidatus Aenigmatarchaeota archaeon]